LAADVSRGGAGVDGREGVPGRTPSNVSRVSKRGWLLFAALSVIWGTPYLLIRIAVRDFSPATLVFFRTGAAGLAFVPLLLRKETIEAMRRRGLPIVVYTVIEVAVPWLLLSRAEQHLTSSLSGLLIATVPLIAVLYSWATGHEGAPGWRRFAGLVIGFGGVAVIVGFGVGRGDALDVLEVFVVAVCYAIGPFVVVTRLADVPTMATVGASLVLTGLGYAPFGLTHLPRRISPEEIVSVALLVVLCTALAFVVYFALIAEVGPARATVITYVNPAVAVVLGVLILHEHVSTGLAVGIPLVLIGSVLGTGGGRSTPEPGRPHDPRTARLLPPTAPARSSGPGDGVAGSEPSVHDPESDQAVDRVGERLGNGRQDLET
jgi:drug/metabolite transporter (DMT)-like permease